MEEDQRTTLDLAQELVSVFHRFNRLLIQNIPSTVFEDDDVTMTQVFTLNALVDEPMTASELARRRHVSLQAVSSMIQPLVERGWITRVRKPDDRRQYLLQPTEEGVARANEMRSEFLNRAAEILEGLSTEEMAAADIFLQGLSRIVMSVQSSNDETSCK